MLEAFRRRVDAVTADAEDDEEFFDPSDFDDEDPARSERTPMLAVD
jgi:hypothetical protein